MQRFQDLRRITQNAICTFFVMCLTDFISFLLSSVVCFPHSIAKQEIHLREFLVSSKEKERKKHQPRALTLHVE